MKEPEEDTNEWKHILCSQISINIVKIFIFLKMIHNVNAISTKIPSLFTKFFLNLKFVGNAKDFKYLKKL